MTPHLLLALALMVTPPELPPTGDTDVVPPAPSQEPHQLGAANAPQAIPLAHDDSGHGEALHPCEVAGACYVWDLQLKQPAIPITPDEGEFALRVWLGCEVRTEVQTPYVRLADVVNRQGSGAAGQAQLMPLHRARMLTLGLDYDLEYHRVIFSFAMYQEQGERPWACGKVVQ